MTTARNHHAFFNEPTYFHLISRCVRRAHLCGRDKHSGQCYEHRKRWLEKRLFELAELFFVDLYGYAIMANHYHLVLCTRPDELGLASDEQIARRWCRLFPHRRVAEAQRIESLCQDAPMIGLYRRRLGDISWLMRCLNEGVARQANKEDECSGRFWQGRFRSQILLDEAAVYTCMAYVDLNPVRAGVSSTPEQCGYTSLHYRVAHHDPEQGLVALNNEAAELPLGLAEYLQLVDETGRYLRDGGCGHISERLEPILVRINMRSSGYLQAVEGLSRLFYRGVGGIGLLVALAQRLNLKWVKGQSASRRVFE